MGKRLRKIRERVEEATEQKSGQTTIVLSPEKKAR